MTQEFYDNAMGHFGAERFLKMVSAAGQISPGGFPNPMNLYELLWSRTDGDQIEPMRKLSI